MKTLFLALLLLPSALLAATFRVNNAPGSAPDYTTIQAAINAAANDDTILIEGSTTPYASFTVENKRLNLIGPGYGLPLNLGTPANKLTAMIGNTEYSYVRTSPTSGGSADGSLVMGLEFLSELTLDACSNVTVARCLFSSSPGNGRLVVNGPSNLVTQCFFGGSSGPVQFANNSSGSRLENSILVQSGPYIQSPSALLYLNNNILASLSAFGTAINADNNIFLTPGTPPTTNCVYRNNLFPGSLPSGLIGTGNLSGISLSTVMPDYLNPVASFDGRYRLALTVPPTGGPTNPALNAGTDGTHIGPFGGANPYVLSGVPPLPTIDELSVPQFAAPGSTLTIRVKVSERP